MGSSVTVGFVLDTIGLLIVSIGRILLCLTLQVHILLSRLILSWTDEPSSSRDPGYYCTRGCIGNELQQCCSSTESEWTGVSPR